MTPPAATVPKRTFVAENARELGFDPGALEELLRRAAHEVESGLLPSVEMAIARQGQVVAELTAGTVHRAGEERPASGDTLYAVFSTTKAITASAFWLLVQDRALDPGQRVIEFVPEFGTNGKEAVRIEHLLTHTAGFPYAPFDPLDWPDRGRRLERFQRWRLNWPPGSRFEYHPTSSMWVVAEIIERVSGQPFATFVRRRVLEPLGLADFHLGLAREEQHRAATVRPVGEPPDPSQAVAIPAAAAAMEEAYLALNRPEIRAIPIPGGGGFSTARTLALFYQALLAARSGSEDGRVWRRATVTEALRVRTDDLRDPYTGRLANRCLGLVVAGDEERTWRGFGRRCSPLAFGHNGAGGQIAWADPETGISFAYCTDGLDRNPLRQGRRTVSLGNRAAAVISAPSGS